MPTLHSIGGVLAPNSLWRHIRIIRTLNWLTVETERISFPTRIGAAISHRLPPNLRCLFWLPPPRRLSSHFRCHYFHFLPFFARLFTVSYFFFYLFECFFCSLHDSDVIFLNITSQRYAAPIA